MINPAIHHLHPDLDPQQLEVIAHGDGPLQVVAGPGSGKTTCIALRAANLVLTGQAQPNELALCTFTKAAAREMHSKFTATLRACGYSGDITPVIVCTIHSLCHRLLTQHGMKIGLAPGYRLLNAHDQFALIETNYERIFGPDRAALIREDDRWVRPEDAAKAARRYFDRISDDLINPGVLIASGMTFQAALGRSYLRYSEILWYSHAADFAHLQSRALALLAKAQAHAEISAGVRHLLVDEYQDTSFAQEQLLLRLASTHRNFYVVGDDDQAIYRFRGARVDNMTRFPTRLPGSRVLYLTNNYRSHRGIVDAFNRWMAAGNWSNPDGADCRFPKTVVPRAAHADDDHPAVVAVMGADRRQEALRLAELFSTLRARGFIADYSQAAILMPSVKRQRSEPYRAALDAAGIPVHLAPSRDELSDDGVARRPTPQDHVLLTTIHQAKGREWPVVAVGLPRRFHQWRDRLDQDLGLFRPRGDTEPPDRVDEFDLRRQYYVAFSRAKRLLVMTGTVPDPVFDPVLVGAPVWPDVDLGNPRGDVSGIRSIQRMAGHTVNIEHVGPLGLSISAGGATRLALGGEVFPSGEPPPR